jgi:hypothetical protein
LARSGKRQEWKGCITTMSGVQRDDTCANLAVDGTYRFSGPTSRRMRAAWHPSPPMRQQTGNHRQHAMIRR